MNNLLRTLVYDNQVSLTVCDATAIAKEGVKLHALSKDAALIFAKTLAANTRLTFPREKHTNASSRRVISAFMKLSDIGEGKIYIG